MRGPLGKADRTRSIGTFSNDTHMPMRRCSEQSCAVLTEPHLAPQNPPYTRTPDLRKLVQGAGREVRSGRRASTDRVTPCLLPYALLLQREPPLRGELDYQNQVRDHAADESDRPDKLLQQRLTSVNGIRRGFESPVVAGVHLAAQLLKAGMTYQARKARMARTVWLFGP